MGLESILGVSFASAARWIIALIVVVAMIFAALWAWRRFGPGGGVRMSSRGKQPRLGIVDVSNVDGTRKLVMLRRDDVEHLVMIGGPNDVVIESGIRQAEPVAALAPAPVAAPAPEPTYIPAPAPASAPRATPAASPEPVAQPAPAAFSARVPPPSSAPQPVPQPQVIPRSPDPMSRPLAANTDQEALDAEMRRMMERMPVAPRS